jgi:6-hydroxycyclohex-1-ene-1-carbonyl-CoA dehydrogenase
MVRADLQPGDRVIVVGATGGVGTYVTQLAKAMGAATVVGIDLDQEKLEGMLDYGADLYISSAGKSVSDIRSAFRALCKEHGLPHNYGWKIFEVTGAGPGRALCRGEADEHDPGHVRRGSRREASKAGGAGAGFLI